VSSVLKHAAHSLMMLSYSSQKLVTA